jgi:3-isopropylmalate/(R)-2-methylmalate dehydratase small subunit
VHLGVRAVIAPSFSGLFFRNAFNLGLLLLTCEQALLLQEGDAVGFDGQNISRAQGEPLPCAPIPDFLMDMVQAGGLLNVLKKHAHQNALQNASP